LKNLWNKKMQLSIIIVSWNVCDKLRDNLQSIYTTRALRKSTHHPASPLSKGRGEEMMEVFVVDNNSYDNTVEMIKKDFPQVNLIANKDNLGFAKANNQAIKQAKGEYVLLLNPDMRVQKDTLQNMVNWINNNKEIGIAGCKLTNEQGEILPHVRAFPTIFDQLAIVLKLPHIFPGILNKYLMKSFDYEIESEVDSIRGSFFMIRLEVIEKIGLLDERYFIWFEEVDYCKRAKEAGFKIMYTPAATCIDYIGQSFKQVKRGKTQIYFRDSMLKYFKKWKPKWQYWILRFAWPFGILIATAGEKLNFKINKKT